MSHYRVGSAARAQLIEFYAYSKKHWGDVQATRYVSGLFILFERIGCGNAVSRPLPGADRAGARVTTYREHFVFWRRVGDKVRIVSILHQRMDHVVRLLAIEASDAGED